jgi:hypothetical protein
MAGDEDTVRAQEAAKQKAQQDKRRQEEEREQQRLRDQERLREAELENQRLREQLMGALAEQQKEPEGQGRLHIAYFGELVPLAGASAGCVSRVCEHGWAGWCLDCAAALVGSQ